MLLIFTQVAVAFQPHLSFPTLQSSKYNTRQLTYLWRGNHLLRPFIQRVNRLKRTRGCAENPHNPSMIFEAAFGNPFHPPRNIHTIANTWGVISPQQRVSLFSALLCLRVFHHTQEQRYAACKIHHCIRKRTIKPKRHRGFCGLRGAGWDCNLRHGSSTMSFAFCKTLPI